MLSRKVVIMTHKISLTCQRVVVIVQDLGQPMGTKKFPGRLCLIVHGNPLQTSDLSLSVGHVVTNRQLKSSISALSMWFVVYNISSLHYPAYSQGAPEFIQRTGSQTLRPKKAKFSELSLFSYVSHQAGASGSG
ncbi:hypothetical protein HOLleu_00972 [Holothuria leucospilota]|uniref:Uncharacterized protein n=1 Tax=Holothuria leucospilota TaxID=206669 RepID=A0A9Q1HK03_HOLLE|nr:hypothetical protein HOLleu_00972 [Holothuria leucospilota]